MTDSGWRILVVDDEMAIRRFLRTSLVAHGNQVIEAASGEEALASAATLRPDLVVLDLGLPDIGGIEVTRRMREWTQIPIIILSVRESETDKVAALDAGADDYVTKPFSAIELLARIRAAMRHATQPAAQSIHEIGDLKIDLERRLVTMRGGDIQLTPTEYDLLRALVLNTGKVLTHHHLLRTVWGVAYENEMHLLRVNISNLRRKIETDPTRPQYLLTEPGVGYRLRGDI